MCCGEKHFDYFFRKDFPKDTLLNAAYRFFRYKIWEYLNPEILYGKIRRFFQRLFRGWDDSELWELCYEFRNYIVPILIDNAVAYNLDNKDDKETVLKYWRMINSFNMVLSSGEFEILKVAREDMKHFVKVLLENPNFAETVADWWVPRLEKFREYMSEAIPSCIPALTRQNLDEDAAFEQWKVIVSKIDAAFSRIKALDDYSTDTLVRKGLSYFIKYFPCLLD